MSFKALTWALEQKVGNPTAKLVLALLADYANNHDYTAFPAQATLAHRAHCSQRQITRLLKTLEQAGFIARFKRGYNTSDIIQLNVTAPIAAASPRSPASARRVPHAAPHPLRHPAPASSKTAPATCQRAHPRLPGPRPAAIASRKSGKNITRKASTIALAALAIMNSASHYE